MKFILKKEHLKLEFTWKEVFFIIIRKAFLLNRRSVYEFSNVIMQIITELTEKYGDQKEHGSIPVKPEEE
jgi:hypothetical protein